MGGDGDGDGDGAGATIPSDSSVSPMPAARDAPTSGFLACAMRTISTSCFVVGCDCPTTQRVTVLRDAPSRSPSACCERPAANCARVTISPASIDPFRCMVSSLQAHSRRDWRRFGRCRARPRPDWRRFRRCKAAPRRGWRICRRRHAILRRGRAPCTLCPELTSRPPERTIPRSWRMCRRGVRTPGPTSARGRPAWRITRGPEPLGRRTWRITRGPEPTSRRGERHARANIALGGPAIASTGAPVARTREILVSTRVRRRPPALFRPLPRHPAD